MKISIIGLGWFGLEVGKKLKELGHEVLGTTRSEIKREKLSLDGFQIEVLDFPLGPSPLLLQSEIILLNIPPTPEQLDWFKSWNWNPNRWMIFISSTSVYLDSPTIIEEGSPLQEQNILVREEEWAQGSFKDWTILRFGGLLGKERHPGKYLSGKSNLNHGLWPVNLLHLDDALGFTLKIIEQKKYHDIYNVVGNEHSTRKDFYTTYAQTHNLPLPHFDPHDLSLGKTVSNEKAKLIYQFKM